jgi:hypothetical protein
VDDVFHAGNTDVRKSLLKSKWRTVNEFTGNDVIVNQRDTLSVNLGETPLVDQGTNSLQRRFTKSDEGFDELQHVHSGLVHTEEGGVVDLAEAQQLQNLSHLGAHAVDTLE